MPAVNIYVDRELAEQIRHHEVATSKVCQGALRRAVRVAERRLEAEAIGRAQPSKQLGDGVSTTGGAA